MKRRTLISTLALPFAAQAQWVTFDPANFIQNYISAFNAVRGYVQQGEQLYLELKSYEQMLAQARSLGHEVSHLSLKQMLDRTQVESLRKVLAAGDELAGEIREIERGFRRRLDEARAARLPWDRYVSIEKDRIARQETAALRRVQTEQAALQRIEQDYEFIRREGAKIGGDESMQQSLQTVNVQLNRMLQQNAELMRQLALAQGSQAAEAQLQQAEERARRLQQADEAEQRRLKVLARIKADQAAIDAFGH